jgi:hypothetical protein
LSTVVAVLLGTLTSYSCELKVNIQSVIKNWYFSSLTVPDMRALRDRLSRSICYSVL